MGRLAEMESPLAPLFGLADKIALLERRVIAAEGSDLESCLKADLARMRWSLDGLIDDTDGIVEEMPWWTDWKSSGLRNGGGHRQ